MYLLILFLPFFGSLITGLGGRWLGHYGANLFSTICIFLTALLSIFAFYEVGFAGTTCHILLGSWISSGIFNVSWEFLFDSLTCIMLLVITLISSLVHLYSIKYMELDPHCPRFMAYLGIFTFFMIVLVTAENLVQMFLGWEGVGLSSYLLINFWYTRLAANQAALKALLLNRIGDFGLSLGIFLIFYIFGSVEYSIIFSTVTTFSKYCIVILGFKVHAFSLIGILLLIGAVGKSAQLGLHTWLPDAMEGPTPVSALIHAATMVTAGVFLIIRFSPLLEFSAVTLCLMAVVGSLTAFFGSMIGIFQNDLKKVIAYSTCSQLGYMIFCCGLSYYTVSIFHLANHAFFKALLFLSAGSIIHAVSNEQDMRKMGALLQFLPVTYSLMLIGTLALVGFPFLTGFYSKDFILELTQISAYSNVNNIYGPLTCWLGNMSVIFTSFYSFRLIYLTFINNFNNNKVILNKVHESSFLITFPLIILGIGSIFIGYLTKDFFIGLGTDFWGTSIFILPFHLNFIEAEFLPVFIKWVPFFLSFLGIFFASILNLTSYNIYKELQSNNIFLFLIFLINKKWYWDIVYNRLFTQSFLKFGYLISYKNIDRGFIELLGPYGLSKFVLLASRKITSIQTGQITHYIFFVTFGVCIFFLFLFPLSFNFGISVDYRLFFLFSFLVFL
uniref:NADH-ubiquinone oxidoreductase chain 5 n=1 Tax=Renouxia sp. TaxID=2485823 RepID=A0A3G3MIJ0_9FLOR|nr:NADH dehydrogenase subunit 5 [Renouxia sp.]